MLACVIFSSSDSFARTRLSLVDFENKVERSSCHRSWFDFGTGLGSGYREMLLNRLVQENKFEILERQTIKRIYSEEHNLINSSKTASPESGQFKKAHYTIAGAITEFELCEAGAGGSVDVGRMIGIGRMKIGGGGARAKVALDVRVIDVETGEIIASVRGEGSRTEKKFNIDAFMKRTDFDIKAAQKTPLGAAMREALENAVKQLVPRIPERKDSLAAKPAESNQNPKPMSQASASETAKNTMIVCEGTRIEHGESCQAIKIINRNESGEEYFVKKMGDSEKPIWVDKMQIHLIRLSLHEPHFLGEAVALDAASFKTGKTPGEEFLICSINHIEGNSSLTARCGAETKTVQKSQVFILPKNRVAQKAALKANEKSLSEQSNLVNFERDFE
jgi:curli biogenesis system outer membrane secretion channel CsgG